MILRNKTKFTQPIGYKKVRPERTIEVPDSIEYDESKFIMVFPGKKQVKKK